MKKILAINHELIVQGSLVFPTLLFAFSVNIDHSMITYVWPFVFVYTVEKVMPFILDGRFNLTSWSEITKFCSILAFVGGLFACIACYFHWEWLSSIAAISIGFAVMGLKLLGDPNKEIEGISIKKAKTIAGFGTIICLIILGFLMMKVSLELGFAFYTFLLGLEVLYAYIVVKREKSKLDLRLSFNFRNLFLVLSVLTVVLIISFFKKTGQISDLSWILIALAVIGIAIELRDILKQPFKLFRIWLGAIKNYTIIYTLLLAFQQNTPEWIFIVFIELMLGGILTSYLIPKLERFNLVSRYKWTLAATFLGLLLTYTVWTYLLGIVITILSTMLLGRWVKKEVPDKNDSIDQKLSVFGSLCNQIILFGMVEVISYFNFDNNIALLVPYLEHQHEYQFSHQMFYLRLSMVLFFFITGIYVIYRDRAYLFEKNKSVHFIQFIKIKIK